MRIRVLNWNLWNGNRAYADVCALLACTRPHIACLQEVSEDMRRFLEREFSDHSFFWARDFYQTRSACRREVCYLGVLARPPLGVARSSIHLFSSPRIRTWLARMLGWDEAIEFQDVSITVQVNGLHTPLMRVFNVHLASATSPRTRRRRFQEVLRTAQGGGHVLICGDLNTLTRWYAWFYRLLQHGSWNELWDREGEVFEQLFAEYGLMNIFAGQPTHSTWCQLDYILPSGHYRVVSAYVLPDSCTSDHQPMLAEIDV